jgi:hypothetical protein
MALCITGETRNQDQLVRIRHAVTKTQSASNHLLYNYLQESPVAVQW